jgi:signal transduction histidine kinase
MRSPLPGTLRGRLAAAMLAVFAMALAASAVLNRLDAPPPGPAAAARASVGEPYQDGLVLAGFTLPALLLIWLVSSWSLRPLARASQEARQMGPQAPLARISRAGLPAEITPLVDAVNAALNRMAEAIAAERRFTENAAHELRTPLAVLGLRLQRARQSPSQVPDWPAIEQDMAHMNRLVAQLLDLARKENSARTAAGGGLVNLSRVAREAAALVLPLAEAQGRTLSVDMPAHLPARGDADDLRDALRNLLENAAVHGQGGIDLRGRVQEGYAIVTVSDQGPGVAADMREAVFERFRKNSNSSGSGLGLAIVREVARAHGGSACFHSGTACVVEFKVPQRIADQ